MEPAATALAWGGPAAAAAAWLAVRSGRSIWVTMALVVGPLGALSALLATPRGAEHVGPAAAAGVGIAAGVGLYAATGAFMFVARRWSSLQRQAEALYQRRKGLSMAAALALAAMVVAPGEELLWRGVVQEALGGPLGEAGGAASAWGVYVAVNALSASLPIVLGAAVGGAAWAGLALWTGGVVAPILCHAVWTALMLVAPPLFGPGGDR